MGIKKYYMVLVLLLTGICVARSQEQVTAIAIDFRVNRTDIDSTYGGNRLHLAEINTFLKGLRNDSLTEIIEVSFCGAASPEGSYQVNRKLAHERMLTLERLVRGKIELPDSLITYNDSYIPWHYLREEIAQSDMPYKTEVLEILDADSSLVDYHHVNTHVDRRVVLLKELDGGRVWQRMLKDYYAAMRNATAVFVTYKRREPLPETDYSIDSIRMNRPAEPVEEEVVEETDTVPAVLPEEWYKGLYVKTNGLGWMMLLSNIAVEVDVADHWSVTVPVYYSAVDYFRNDLKFRTFALQPEVRYWFSDENRGWFVGAHVGFAYYNLAFMDNWRIQDRQGTTPTLGGGFSGGYRLTIDGNSPWQIEFSLGAGAYPLHYDRFYNEPDGAWHDTKKMTYFGLDNAAVTIAYKFDLKKKGGKR